MMGSGIALLPTAFAPIGSITLIGWLVASAGAIMLAFVYAQLGTTDPETAGPVAYAGEVSPILGYQAGQLYFHSAWIGNLGVSITAVAYLSVFWPALNEAIPASIGAIICIWVFAALNLIGAKKLGHFVTIGVAALLVPVILTGTVGWFFFEGKLFADNWHVGKQSDTSAIFLSVTLCIWAFVGLEAASVDAGLIKNPKKNVPRATMIGVLVVAIVSVASCTVIAGMFPAKDVANSGAPFSMAMAHMIKGIGGGHTWQLVGSYATSIAAVLACVMSLAAWIMLLAEVAARNAEDGTMMKRYVKRNKRGAPVWGIIVPAIYASVLMVIVILLTEGQPVGTVFGKIAGVSVLFILIPYFYSALRYVQIDKKKGPKNRRAVLPLVVGAGAIAWSFIAFAGENGWLLSISLLIILGIFIQYVLSDRTEFEARMLDLRDLTHNRLLIERDAEEAAEAAVAAGKPPPPPPEGPKDPPPTPPST